MLKNSVFSGRPLWMSPITDFHDHAKQYEARVSRTARVKRMLSVSEHGEKNPLVVDRS